MKKTVGIIFADEMEYLPFEKYADTLGAEKKIRNGNESLSFVLKEGENELEVIAVKCGIGKVNASTAAAFLMGCDKADYILNAGLSGAISKCRREDIVIGDSYVECDFDLTAIGYKPGQKSRTEEWIIPASPELLELAKKQGYMTGRLGTGDIFLTDKEKKDFFKKEFEINAFDMETGALAHVCRKNGTPFLSIRKISDDADDSSINDYTEMNNRAEACLTEILAELLKELVK